MNDTKGPGQPSPALAELLLAPSLQELQNAATTGRLTDAQFCNFWRKAAAQAHLRGNLVTLAKLLQLLAHAPARHTQWGQLLLQEYTGLLRLREGRFGEALNALHIRQQLAWDVADATEIALSNLELAQAHLFLYQLKEAAEYLKETQKWVEIAGEPALQVRLLNRQAELASQQRLTEQSLALARQALALAVQQRLRVEQGVAYDRLGVNYYHHREWSQAEQAFREALRLRQTVRDQVGLAETWLNLSNLQLKQGQEAAALQSASNSLAIMEKLENPFGIAQALHQKAVILLKTGQPAEALPWAERALELRLTQSEPTRQAQAYNSLSRIQAALGQAQAAQEGHLKVLALYLPAYANPLWVDLLVEAGNYLLRVDFDTQKYWPQAFQGYRIALGIVEQNQNLYYLAPVLGRMARALLKLDGLGGIQEAIRCYQLELKLVGEIDSPAVAAQDAIALRAEALTGLQVCASLLRRQQP